MSLFYRFHALFSRTSSTGRCPGAVLISGPAGRGARRWAWGEGRRRIACLIRPVTQNCDCHLWLVCLFVVPGGKSHLEQPFCSASMTAAGAWAIHPVPHRGSPLSTPATTWKPASYMVTVVAFIQDEGGAVQHT